MDLREELGEVTERVHRSEERKIGLTTAIVAVFLALTTMLGHRAHTEEAVLTTRVADQWSFYQAKNIRSHLYAADARLAALHGPGGRQTQLLFDQESARQKQDATKISGEARALEKEVTITAGRARLFDSAEIFLEIAIVLCSISLLTGSPGYWKTSFLSTAAGVALMIIALFR